MRLIIEVRKKSLIVLPVFDSGIAGDHFDVPPETVRYRREYRGIPYVELVKAARAAGPDGIVEIQEKQLP